MAAAKRPKAKQQQNQPAPAPLSQADQETILDEFCKVCVQIWIDRQLYQSVYEIGKEQERLFKDVAPYYFGDVRIIMVHHLFLQFSKITDPARSGKKSNLTTNFVLEEFPWPDVIKQQLHDINIRLMKFRGFIEIARSKRIAHIDLNMQIAQRENLGAFPEGDDWKFIEDLQQFVDIAYRQVFNGAPFDIKAGAATDTHLLIRALEKAAAYDACNKCNDGERAKNLLDRRQ